MASATGRKTPFQNQEMLETQLFTWRLRPHVTHLPTAPPPGQNGVTLLNPARNSKSTNLSGVTRLSTNPASHSLSSSVLPTTANSLLQVHQASQNLEKFLRYQEFEVEAGQTLGLHSMWSLFLVSCGSSGIAQQKSNTNVAGGSSSTPASSSSSSSHPSANSDFIGLFLRKIIKSTKSPSNYSSGKGDEIVARYKIEIMDMEGEVLYVKDLEATPKDTLEVGFWDWKKIVPLSKFHSTKEKQSGKDDHLPTHSGKGSDEESLLLLRVAFTLISRRKETGKGRMTDGGSHSQPEMSTRQAANAFLSLVTSPKSLQPDVIIEIPNRRKFSVHKKILVDRSSFFLKLLGPADTGPSRGSVVKIDDISANTMELVLKHIYTGQLEEEWTTNPVTITELIYASEKYGLPAIKEFCSKHLVKAATKNNCYKLLEVAQMHNLEQAAEDLMSYASEGISSNTNSRKTSAESLGTETT